MSTSEVTVITSPPGRTQHGEFLTRLVVTHDFGVPHGRLSADVQVVETSTPTVKHLDGVHVPDHRRVVHRGDTVLVGDGKVVGLNKKENCLDRKLAGLQR